MQKIFGVFMVFIGLHATAQKLPTDAVVMQDTKKAIKTAAVQKAEFTSDWKMERESGYTFANLAKRAVQVEVKEHATGKMKRYEGLAIYSRGSSTDAWLFSRFFTYTNTIEEIGAGVKTETLLQYTLKGMGGERPFDWFGEISGVYGVYNVVVIPGSYKKRTDRNQYWEVEFEVEQRWDYKFLVKRKYKKSVDLYEIQDTNEWHFVVGNLGEKQLERKEMQPEQLDKIPSLQKVGFTKIYRANGEQAKTAEAPAPAPEAQSVGTSTEAPKPAVKKPLINFKIGN
jgi:hypothetical protein